MAVLPALAGHRFRGPEIPDDASRMAALINASNDADGIEGHTSVDEVASNYRHLEHCDRRQT